MLAHYTFHDEQSSNKLLIQFFKNNRPKTFNVIIVCNYCTTKKIWKAPFYNVNFMIHNQIISKMKKNSLLVVTCFLCVGIFFSCKKNNEQSAEDAANVELQAQMGASEHGLGADLLDDATFNAIPKIDLVALRSRLIGSKGTAIPAAYQIPNNTPGNQGGEGSCVAWATAYAALSSLEHNYGGQMPFPDATRSPEYVYNQIKVRQQCSSGAYVTTGLNLLVNQGVCSWTEMPYTDVSCNTQPSATQKTAASTHKATSWSAINKADIAGLKGILAVNVPVVIAVTVDGTFDALSASNPIWKAHGGRVRGGHAICVVGYDDSKNAFKVQNSWGSTWCSSGYFYIDYGFFAQQTNGAINEIYAVYKN